MLAMKESRPAYQEFYWDEQDLYADTMDDRSATPWTFAEMLTRAMDLEGTAPKHYNIVDGKFVPEHDELDRLRFCIDDRLRGAAQTITSLRGPTNSARHPAVPVHVASTTGPRWAHLTPGLPSD